MKRRYYLAMACMLLVGGLQAVMARDVSSFNNDWQFKRGPFSSEPRTAAAQWNGKWQQVNVPHTWNAKDMQTVVNGYYEGTGYYRKTFNVPADGKGKRYFLRFEGVGACAEVYVNDRLVGSHKGGYSAFAVEMTGALQFGKENTVLVKADNQSRPDVIPVNHQLFGVYGGIYRPVWLIVTEGANITVTDHASPGVYITQDNVTSKSADVAVKVKLDNGTLKPVDVTLENIIYTREGKKVASEARRINLTPQGTQAHTMHFRISRPHLWQGIEDPYLYRVETSLTVA